MRRFLFVLALAGILLSACGGREIKEPVSSSRGEKQAVPVRIMVLEPRSFAEFLEVTGTVKARNHIHIVVEEGGILKEIQIDKGQNAQAGSVLAVLENKVLAAGFRQATAMMKQAELDYRSKKVLFDKKAISENEYLNAKYALDSAQAAQALARARYEKLTVTAPIGGLVNRRYYDRGAYANPMTPIFELIDNQQLRVVAGVAERFMGNIQIGTPVTLTFDAYPTLTLESQITYISRSIDSQTRTFEVEVEIPNPQGMLAPEMIANLKIRRQAFENRIVVPLDTLIESEEGWHVFVEENQRAIKVPVRRLAVYEDTVLVDGLQAGQRLITVGHQNLSEGDPLTMVEI